MGASDNVFWLRQWHDGRTVVASRIGNNEVHVRVGDEAQTRVLPVDEWRALRIWSGPVPSVSNAESAVGGAKDGLRDAGKAATKPSRERLGSDGPPS